MNHAFELIPLTIEARGEVITSNVDEVREMVREALANINRDLVSDEDFGQAEKDVKALKGVEERFLDAKEKALKDAEALHQLFAAIDATVEEVRKPRLELEKLIAKRKDEVKAELIAEAMEKLDCVHRMKPVFAKSLAESVKGKRTIDTMRKALDTIVTIHNGMIGRSRKMIETFAKAHGEELVMDREELETKSPDSVEAELRRRFEAKKATEERKRLEAEAAAARAAEAKAKAEAEAAKVSPENVVPMAAPQRNNPHNLPEPPKIGGIPTGPSPIAEWTAWLTACKTTFAALKTAKDGLRHPENIRRAGILADGVNAAWKAMKEAGEEVEA